MSVAGINRAAIAHTIITPCIIIKIPNYISNIKQEDMGGCDDDYDIGI